MQSIITTMDTRNCRYKQKFQVPKRQTYVSDFFKSLLFLSYYYFNLKRFIVYCATFN